MIVSEIHTLDKSLTARQHGLTRFGAAPPLEPWGSVALWISLGFAIFLIEVRLGVAVDY